MLLWFYIQGSRGESSEHVDIERYGRNLAEIYRRLVPRAKHIIWTTTTPCPSIPGYSSRGRTEENVRLYNVKALQSLQAAAAAAVSATTAAAGKNHTSTTSQPPPQLLHDKVFWAEEHRVQRSACDPDRLSVHFSDDGAEVFVANQIG